MAEGRTKWPAAPDGWYVEPESATTFLLARERFPGPILDPCCGQGNIVRACHDRGLEAYGADLRARRGAAGQAWFVAQEDYLEAGHSAPSIIMNPPYGRALLAEAFIRRAWADPATKKLAAFVNSKFLFAERRSAGLFRDMPPARIHPVIPRPSCPPGQFLLDGGKAEGGVENFVWLVWERDAAPGSLFVWNGEVGNRGDATSPRPLGGKG